MEEIGITLRVGASSGFAAHDVIGRCAWMTPFQSSDWREIWNRSLGAFGKTSPVTAILTRAGRSLAVLPLAASETSGLRILTWHANDQNDYGAPIIVSDEVAAFCALDGEEMMRRIAGELGNVDLVYLPKQPATIGGHGNPLIFNGSVTHHVGAHAINFVSGETWDDFLVRKRSASTRQQLRKKQRNLEKLGKVDFRRAATPEEARTIVEHCLDTKSRQLARLGHHDPFAAPAVRNFLIDYFAAGVGHSTWAVALRLDGEPIATSIGFAHPNEWLLYQMAMDPDHAQNCSPGTQLLMGIMRHCIGGGIKRLDLAMGDEGYKYEWCDEHQALFTSCLPMTRMGRLAGLLIRTKAKTHRRIAAHPRLYDLGKSLKRRLRARGMPV